MSAVGYLQVRAYTSSAEFPLRDVAIAITSETGELIAMRLTDRSGLMPQVEIPVPDKSESQSPGASEHPYASVTLYAHKNGYEEIEADTIQIFAGTTTYQNLEMIPLSQLPDPYDDTIVYRTPPQNL